MRMKCIILFKDIPFIPAHIFAKAILIIVKAVSKKGTIMKRKYVKQIFILNFMHWHGIKIYTAREYKHNFQKRPVLAQMNL